MSLTDSAFKSTLVSQKIEHAYFLANRKCEEGDASFARVGWKAAQARDPKLLIALERMAEETLELQEKQMGQHMRAASTSFREQQGTTEHQLCREAYRMCDQGTPLENFSWIYGAAAWLCGYNI